MMVISIQDLEEYYDEMLDSVEDIKLLKSKLIELESKDTLFTTLYQTLESLNIALVQNMNRMGQLEVHILSQKSI